MRVCFRAIFGGIEIVNLTATTTLCLLLLVTVTTVNATEKAVPSDAPVETLLPSRELLEFLGQFETSQGEWIDPMELEKLSMEDTTSNDNDRHQQADQNSTTEGKSSVD